MANYFRYANNKYSVISNKRPTNQSNPTVLRKITKRLERLILENPNIELTELQKLFVKEIKENDHIALKANNIDIAHNIAISVIMDVIAQRMNNPLLCQDKQYEQFVDDLLSTEDDDGKIKVKEFFENLSDVSILPQKKIEQASEVVAHLNRASKNLIPGYSSSNRSIGNNRDPHLAKNKQNNQFVETPTSKKLSQSADAFFRKIYTPKTRKTMDGKTEAQSSSISNNRFTAYFFEKKNRQETNLQPNTSTTRKARIGI